MKLKKYFTQLFLAIITSTPWISPAAFAELTSGGYSTNGYIANAGILLGPAFVSNGGGTNFNIGADADYKLIPNAEVGFYYSHISLGAVTLTNGQTLSATLNHLAAEGNYFFNEVLDGLRGGVKLGLQWHSQSGALVPSQNFTNTNILFGIAAGWDYMIAPNFTVGPELNYIFTTESNGPSTFNVLGMGKFWL